MIAIGPARRGQDVLLIDGDKQSTALARLSEEAFPKIERMAPCP